MKRITIICTDNDAEDILMQLRNFEEDGHNEEGFDVAVNEYTVMSDDEGRGE